MTLTLSYQEAKEKAFALANARQDCVIVQNGDVVAGSFYGDYYRFERHGTKSSIAIVNDTLAVTCTDPCEVLTSGPRFDEAAAVIDALVLSDD